MILQDFILLNEKILKNKYKKVKIVKYIDVNIVEGFVHEPFVEKNTNLSVKGRRIDNKNKNDLNCNATLVVFDCNDGKSFKKEFSIFVKEDSCNL